MNKEVAILTYKDFFLSYNVILFLIELRSYKSVFLQIFSLNNVFTKLLRFKSSTIRMNLQLTRNNPIWPTQISCHDKIILKTILQTFKYSSFQLYKRLNFLLCARHTKVFY